MAMRFYMLLLGLTFLQLAGCSSGPELQTLPVDGVVLAYGDSITRGTGAANNQSYPAILSNLIGRRVVNAGVPGEITAEGLARLPETLDREKPALVILCHGANDLMRGMDQRRTADNLRGMLGLIRARGASAVLVSVPAIGLSLAPPPFYVEVARGGGHTMRAEGACPRTWNKISQVRYRTSQRGWLPAPWPKPWRRCSGITGRFRERNSKIEWL